MKLNDAIELGKTDRWQEAHVRVSPDNRNQWFVLLWDTQYKSFVLSDNEDRPIATEEINELAELVRSIGLKDFTVFL